MTHMAGAYPGFCNMKQQGVLCTLLDRRLVHPRVSPIWMDGERRPLEMKFPIQGNTGMESTQGKNADFPIFFPLFKRSIHGPLFYFIVPVQFVITKICYQTN